MDSLLAKNRIRLQTGYVFVLIGLMLAIGCAPTRVSKANAPVGKPGAEQVSNNEAQEEPAAVYEPLLAPLDAPPPAQQPAPPVVLPVSQIAEAAAPAPPRQRRSVYQVNEQTFEQHVLQADTPVLVDFYADWCGPCKALSPTLDELAAETHNAKVVKVNIDHSPRLAAYYGVRSVPNLLVFKNGRVSARQTGAANKAELKKMLDVPDAAPRVSRAVDPRLHVDPTRQIASEEQTLGRLSQHGQAVGGR